MFFRSLRWRLQAWYGAILIALVTAFAFAAYTLERARQLRETDQELIQRVSMLAVGMQTSTRRELALGEGGRRFHYIIWRPNGELYARSVDGRFPTEVPPRDAVTPRDRDGLREAFGWLGTGECVLVNCSLEPDAAALRKLALTLAGSAVATVALGLIGGWWIATRAIRPIEDIGAAAARITSGDLSQRIPTAGQASELSALAEVLNTTFARLEAAFAQQVRFTSDAAHELRTPVSIILTQAQTTLARERTPEEYREAMGTAQRAARRMRGLIESLLELARLDAGKHGLKPAAGDLAEVAREAAELLGPLLAERNVTLQRELAPAPCRVDATRFGQVAANLLSNAVQHGRPGGVVRLATRLDGDQAVLEVADDGPGISERDLPHIFERFYRGDPSRTGGAKGRGGLGLSICKAIVEAHGGRIEAGPAEGGGACFRVRLPVGAAA
ncbi:MAG: HAMP domain-containing protein [Verrucomicrobia bacterium]|nr:HAMP domain-containing protein [Verrucomicrobiota bacterium]